MSIQKNIIAEILVLFVFVIPVLAQEKINDFPVLRGPYLGQTPPGMTAEIFAPGIISTSLNESRICFSPDGRYIFLTGLYITHNWGNKSLAYSDIINYYTKPGYGRADIYWVNTKIIEELRSNK